MVGKNENIKKKPFFENNSYIILFETFINSARKL